MRRLSCLAVFALLAFATFAPANPIVRSRGIGHALGIARNVGAVFGLASYSACAPAAAFVPMQAAVDCNIQQAQLVPQAGYSLGLQRSFASSYSLGAAFDPGLSQVVVNRGVILRQRAIVHRLRGLFRGGQLVRNRTVIRVRH